MKYSKSHTCYLDKDGEEVPSVTTVLKILNKPALVKWANHLGFKHMSVDSVLEESASLGTLVHSLVHAYLMDMYFIYTGGRYMKTVVIKHLDSFITWSKTHAIQPIIMEQSYVDNKYRFGGTLDFYGVVDGKNTIMDFKTSRGVYSSMFLQLAAYCILLEKEGYKVDRVAIININENGCKEKFMTREELEPYIDVFKDLIGVFHNWFDLNVEHKWGSIL